MTVTSETSEAYMDRTHASLARRVYDLAQAEPTLALVGAVVEGYVLNLGCGWPAWAVAAKAGALSDGEQRLWDLLCEVVEAERSAWVPPS